MKLDATGTGSDGIRVTASAGARWKMLFASIRADTRFEVSPDAVLTVRELKLGSRNPLVAFALLFTRKHIRKIIDVPHDLSDMLASESGAAGPGAVRIHDLHVSAGTQLAVSGRVN